jgi:hypothetical protein
MAEEYGNYIWHDEPTDEAALKPLLEQNASEQMESLGKPYGPVTYEFNIKRDRFDEEGNPVSGYSSGWRATLSG